ncbi:unnamed protein product [Lota lota]
MWSCVRFPCMTAPSDDSAAETLWSNSATCLQRLALPLSGVPRFRAAIGAGAGVWLHIFLWRLYSRVTWLLPKKEQGHRQQEADVSGEEKNEGGAPPFGHHCFLMQGTQNRNPRPSTLTPPPPPPY